MADLLVPARFCGPPRSGNGGWTAGALAALFPPDGRALEVTLRRPPPLDTPLPVRREDDQLLAGDVATAKPAAAEPGSLEPVEADEARAAEASYPGLAKHPFPTCFSCGTEREDGLRIFPGRVGEEPTRVAATWTPATDLDQGHGHTSLAVAWSALDCAGGWAGDFGERLMVLGRMTALVHALPRIGEEHVVVGQAVATEGRKTFTATTLFDSAGLPVGSARHVWFDVDPARFN